MNWDLCRVRPKKLTDWLLAR